jgi:biotin synthase
LDFKNAVNQLLYIAELVTCSSRKLFLTLVSRTIQTQTSIFAPSKNKSMLKQTSFNRKKPLYFRRWSRKGYAVFVSRHNEVVISASAICSKLLPKNKQFNKIMYSISQLEEKVFRGEPIDAEEALWLVLFAEKEALYAAANRIREHFCGNKIDLCTIMNARSGKCTEDCKWCSQSSYHKTDVKVYELINHDEAVQQAHLNKKAGAHKFSLVTSGHDITHKNLDKLCAIYKDIAKTNDIHLCASMGLLDTEKLDKLTDVGVKMIGCNLETAPSYFSELCTTHTTDEKIKTLKLARSKGMTLCSGGIIGLGETMAQRVELAIVLQGLAVESIPLNILTAIAGTDLQNATPVPDEDILNTFAMFRFTNPKATIRFGAGRIMIQHMQERALKAGMNAALIGDLLTTIGTKMNEDIVNFKNAGFIC